MFEISLITYLVFLLLEELKEGFVSYNFDLNIVLYIVIVSGVLSVFAKEDPSIKLMARNKEKPEKIRKIDWLFIFGLGVLGGFLIFYKTEEIGWISYVISGISGILIILLSVLILKGDDDEEHE